MTLSELLDNEDFRAGRKLAMNDQDHAAVFRFHKMVGTQCSTGGSWFGWSITPADLRASWRLVSPEKE